MLIRVCTAALRESPARTAREYRSAAPSAAAAATVSPAAFADGGISSIGALYYLVVPVALAYLLFGAWVVASIVLLRRRKRSASTAGLVVYVAAGVLVIVLGIVAGLFGGAGQQAATWIGVLLQTLLIGTVTVLAVRKAGAAPESTR